MEREIPKPMKIPLLTLALVATLACLAGAQTYPKGDLNENYIVDLTDLQLFAQEWLDASCSAPNCSADLDGVPGVNLNDFAFIASNWQVHGRIPLAINEFMARNNSLTGIHDEWGDYDDWIEIYNYGEDAINIGGMWVTDSLDVGPRWQIPRGNPAVTTIASGGYLLIWADNEIGEGALHVPFALDGGGEDIGLYDSDRNLIDSIGFGPQQQNKSYGRLPDGSAGWHIFDSPTPRRPNHGAPIAVVINEIMYHPYHLWDEVHNLYEPENMALEYIELWNRSIEAVNLAGWKFIEGVDFVFPDVTLNAGQYLVVAADVNAFKNKYPGVSNVIGGWTGRLANSGEDIVLVDDANSTIDWLYYADQGDWARRELGPLEVGYRGWIWVAEHDGDGKSLELINVALPNECGHNWTASSTDNGTPGVINSVIDNDIAPLIVDVTHFPIMPGPNDTTTVTARIIDELATGVGVMLHYRIDRSVYVKDVYPHHDPNDYNDLAMFDDGSHGDEQAGDGIYGTQIPAHSNNTIIEFYVEAHDTAGNKRTWPAPALIDGISEQVTNALYQVDNMFDPYAPWIAGSQPVYHIIMTNAEKAKMRDIVSHSTLEGPNAQMNATFISVDGVDTKLRYTIGVRNRGHGTRNDFPNNYHINFVHDQPWKDVTALNLNTKFTYLQLVGNALFRMSGLAQCDTAAVEIRVNGENQADTDPTATYGSYVHLESINSDFTDSHYPEDGAGNAYKCMRKTHQADLRYEGATPTLYRQNYFKESNSMQDDWSDLIELCNVLSNTPDQTYVQEVNRVINAEQWLRHIAVNVILNNKETTLANGNGDDYYLYSGVEDPRFVLIQHDLDSVCGLGQNTGLYNDPILQARGIPAIKRFLEHPQFAPRFYFHLRDLIETVFAAGRINPFLDEFLGDWIPPTTINQMKNFIAQRNTYILSLIPSQLTIGTDLPQSGGYYKTLVNNAAIYGTADIINTRSVLANAHLASWLPVDGRWSISVTALKPGINRIIVQTFDGPNGSGNELKEGYIDIWYDDGGDVDISGTLATNRTLDAASGPWHVTNDITVPVGITLTIQLGTTLFFDADTGITINGRLLAEGTEFARIRFTKTPGAGSWAGLQFLNSSQQSRIAYADMEYCDSGDCAVKADYAAVYMDHVIWGNHTKQYLTFDDSSIILTNSVLPSLTGAELVHFWGFPANGYALIEGNWFGTTTGYNDIIDFTGGQRPGPIVQFLNNVFTGASDDCIDLDAADAHVEGNVFMHVHMDSPRESVSHAVTTGTEYSQVSELTVVRNLFYDVDHALLSKDGGYITAVNNTIVHTTVAAINMYEARSGQWQGKGFYGDGNIFYDAARMFENPDWAGHPTSIIMNHSIFPIIPGDPIVWTGSGNSQDDPQLYNTTNVTDPPVDFMLHPTSSPAIGTGPNGQDMGGLVPAGASISGEPPPRTWRNSAILTVGGPDIYGYKYRVNNGQWSGEILRPEPQLPDIPIQPLAHILLTNLPDGTYTVYVIIKNSASVWQNESEAVASDTWTVDSSYSKLSLSELIADNNSAFEHEGQYPDIIELYYDGPVPLDLTGIKITDNQSDPNKFVFSGGNMSPGEYLILYADTNTAASGLHLGFALNREGDSVYLYDKNGLLLDSVQFGLQLTDLSVGRIGRDGRWTLTAPTFGQENIAQPLGNPDTVKINEWFTNGLVLFVDDFVELYNPHPSPVDIGGMYLTDNPVNQQDKHKISPLSFIDSNGFAVYVADDSNGPGHLNFRLSADTEMIGLFDAQLNQIDEVIYGPQTTDVSYGRAPDGVENFEFFVLPTPGISNPSLRTIDIDVTLAAENATKRVIVPAFEGHIGQTWNSDPNFDDSGWNDGVFIPAKTGGVGYDYTQTSYDPYISYDVEAAIYNKNDTCYIRIPFTISDSPSDFTKMVIRVRYDDGFIAYINGQKVAERNAPGIPVWNSGATGQHADAAAVVFEDIVISNRIGSLWQGNNILAIHALNESGNRSDFLLSVELKATITRTEGEFPFLSALDLLDGLRVTEVMYHAPEGSEYDYIELKNISNVILDLNGVRFTEGIDFTFPAVTLDPGEYIVVICNLTAFESEYGTGINIAGQYTGNLSNAGEDIVLRLPVPLEAAILRFRYRDSWYPTTDGSGDALVIRDPTAHPATWGDPESWQPAAPTPGEP
jgi:hypothetical protein